jgi:hypothetical protein
MTTTFTAAAATSASEPGSAALVDVDNLLHRGFDRRARLSRPQAILDARGLATALRSRGVDRGTICRNWAFSKIAREFWAGFGFMVSSSGTNCDQQVVAEARRYAEDGCQTLILVSGDGDYCDLVDRLRRNGIFVEVWARRSSSSRDLLRLANRVQYVDPFVLPHASARGASRAPENRVATLTSRRVDKHVQRLWAPQFGIRGARTVSLDWSAMGADLAA